MYPEARSVRLWVRHGYWVAIAYVIGFFVMLLALGWNPHPTHKLPRPAASAAATVAAPVPPSLATVATARPLTQ
jgi:hypothetical protein